MLVCQRWRRGKGSGDDEVDDGGGSCRVTGEGGSDLSFSVIFSIIMDFVYSAFGQAKKTAAVVSVFTFFKSIYYVSFPFSLDCLMLCFLRGRWLHCGVWIYIPQ
jgi:hypothetical protein